MSLSYEQREKAFMESGMYLTDEAIENLVASSTQVGGTHYQLPIQPLEYILKNGLGYIEGNVVKYVTRHRAKNGKEDIKKAIHYLNLLLENYDEQ